MQRQSSYGTFVADIENHIVIGKQSLVQPLYLCRRSRLGMAHHQIFAIWMDGEIIAIEIGSCGICHIQGSLILSVDVAEVCTVGIGISPFQQIDGSCTRFGNHQCQYQHQLHPADSARQTEGECAAFPLLAFCMDIADGEERAHLLVFIDDALAIEQTEAMTARIGAVEDVGQGCFVHALACIGYGNLNKGFIHHLGANLHLSTARCKLAGVIGNGVDHEESQGAVGLHHGIGRLHLQVHAAHLETHLAFGHNVEEWLQREAFDTEVDGSLAHLNPIGEHCIVLINLVGQF